MTCGSDLATPLLAAGSGSSGGPSAVFVHGLASAGRSWSGFAQTLPAGLGRIAVDLPGHGRSGRRKPYSFGHMATEVGRVCASLPGPVTLVGHSLGGAVALLVGTGLFGADVQRVVTIGTKVRWTDAEIERARAVAAKPAKVFASRDGALDFWRRVAGVPGDVALGDDLVADVLAEDAGGWRLSYDPAVAGLGAAPVPELTAMTAAEVVVVRGELDELLTAADADAAGGGTVVTVPGCGHSPHVQDPRLLATLLGY